MSKKERDAMTV